MTGGRKKNGKKGCGIGLYYGEVYDGETKSGWETTRREATEFSSTAGGYFPARPGIPSDSLVYRE